MKPDRKHRYEHYQLIMSFLCEELPGKGWRVQKPIEKAPGYFDDLWGDKRENLVRRFLKLPTVQHDRRVADKLVKEIQEKARLDKPKT